MSTDVNEQLFKQEALEEQSERVSERRIRQHCEDVIQEVVDGLRSPAEESRARIPVRRTQSLKLRTDGLQVKGIKMEPPVEAVEEVETVGEMRSPDVKAVADISLQAVESARMIVSDTVKEVSSEHGSLEELDEPNLAEQCQKWQNSAGLRLDDLDSALRTDEIVDDADEDQKTTVTEVTNDESATTEVSDGAGEIDATSELKTAAPVKTSAVIEISISASDVPKPKMTLHDGAELKQSANDRHHEEPIPMIDDISPVKAEVDGGEPSSGTGANVQRQHNGSKTGSPEALGKAARLRQRVKQGCTLV